MSSFNGTSGGYRHRAEHSRFNHCIPFFPLMDENPYVRVKPVVVDCAYASDLAPRLADSGQVIGF